MNKKLLNVIKKYPLQTKVRPILNCVHTIANNKTVVTEATNSSIAIWHIDNIENDLSFETLQDLDGNYVDCSQYPKLERLFNPDLLNKIVLEDKVIDEITANVKVNHKNKTELIEYILNEVHYTISTKYLKIVMDTINTFKHKKVSIGTKEKYTPIYFLIESEQGKTEILLCPDRKWVNYEI